LDSFVNPTATDTLDSATVPHAAQHDNINDAMAAVQVTLGVNPQGGSATVVARLTAIESNVTSATSTANTALSTANSASATANSASATANSANATAIAAQSAVAAKANVDQAMFVGTTALTINRSSASQTLTGVSIDGNADNVTGVVDVTNGGTGKTAIPVASDWVSGRTYAVGDIVVSNLAYWVRRTNGSGTIGPGGDPTNWAQRTSTAATNGSSQAGSFVGYNANGGIFAQGIGIAGVGGSAPSTGLIVSNGGITVSGTGNGVAISNNGNVTLGTSGTAGGSVIFATAGGIQLLQGSTGTGSQTLPATAGTLLNTASSLDPTKLSAGTAGIDISGNAATATSATNVSGTVAFANGGTNATTFAGARDSLGILGGFQVLTSATTNGNGTTLVSIFPSATQNFTLKANTVYFFEALTILTKAASTGTSGSWVVGFNFSQTTQNLYWDAFASSRNLTTGTYTGGDVGTSTTITIGTGNQTATTSVIRYKGWFQTNATTGGTLAPTYAQSAAPTSGNPACQPGTYFKLFEYGTSLPVVSGSWGA
jgi:hypothetical protein